MDNYEENKTIDEESLINKAFQELLDTYLASQHRKKVELITKAFNFARQAHKGVRRHSGEPYIMHPLAVAHIVCKEIGLGSTSICAALLHDVVEDTDYTIEDIRNLFGDKIAEIVNGLMTIPNLIALAALGNQLLLLMKEYEKDPAFVKPVEVNHADIHQRKPLRTLSHAEVPSPGRRCQEGG